MCDKPHGTLEIISMLINTNENEIHNVLEVG